MPKIQGPRNPKSSGEIAAPKQDVKGQDLSARQVRGPEQPSIEARRITGDFPTDPASKSAISTPSDSFGVSQSGQHRHIGGAKADGFLKELDQLWTRGEYPALVQEMGRELDLLGRKNFAELGVNEAQHVFSQLHILQNRLISVCNKLSLADNPNDSLKALGLMQKVGDLRTEIFASIVALRKQKFPEAHEPWQLYRNTMKSQGFHTPNAIEAYYLDKSRDFIRAGGDFSQIQPVGSDFIQNLKSGELCEWVVDAYDRARISRSDVPVPANHTLMAQGDDVLSAGSLRVYKNDEGEISNVVVGTYSGHYLASVDSLQHMVRHLLAAGVKPELISVQDDEAVGSRVLPEFLHALSGVKGAQAQAEIAQLAAKSQAWGTPTSPEMEAINLGRNVDPDLQRMQGDLNEALFSLRKSSSIFMQKGVIMESQGEATHLVQSIDDVCRLAQVAGNPQAYHEGRALLQHLSTLPDLHVDQGAKKVFADAMQVRETDRFVDVRPDSADLFGARPSERRGRIIATLNPEATVAELRQMVKAGMDVGRINAARGTIPEHKALIGRLRQAAAECGKPVSVMMDLAGPKIRLGKFANPNNIEYNDIALKKGQKLTLTTKDVMGSDALLPVDYPYLGQDVKVGDPIFLNDGKVKLKALSSKIDADGEGVVEAEVEVEGIVWDRKGINLPGSKLSMPTVTDEDLVNLEGLINDVDIVCISFVREPEDVLIVRQKMAEYGRNLPIIAKMERPEAMENLERIATVADGMMVARGDLGVEIGYENVPEAERAINQMGNVLGKPTIVATEVMQSMTKESRPTRADVEGVFSAIHDQGAEAVMLGRETSFGKFPAETVRAAGRVISRAEQAAIKDNHGVRAAMPKDASMSPLDLHLSHLNYKGN
ncbi:MAG: pyruvate kinase [Myxococcota bacterium]|jgi:pyruvate kinase|nr:pyruvate kinase [Myxococcota bacterium]